MLTITEHTPDRLVLHTARTWLRVLSLIVLFNSVLSVILLITQATDLIAGGTFGADRIPALLTFLMVGTGFVGFSLFLLLNAGRGVTVVFDRESATVTITSARALRAYTETHSLYAVANVRVERNDEIRAFALILILRSGVQIPLATVPQHQQPHLEALIAGVRGFLRG